MKGVRKEKSYWILLIFACLWAFATLYPFVIAVFSSLKDNDGILGDMLKVPTHPLWSNYIKALVGARIDRSIFNSLIVAVFSTMGILLFSSMIAFVLARTDFKFNKAIFALFLMGIVLPIYATLIPLAKMVTHIPFMKSNSFSTLILLYIAFNLPTSIFILTGYMKGISKELEEAAIIDGCSVPVLFFHILLPISVPAISTAGILAFLHCYNEMTFALVFLSDRAKYTISLGMLYFSGEKTVDMGPMFAGIVLATIPMVVIYMLFQEQIQAGMVAGAVKE
ncbi:carbohydrate ABC transporter permease [uncultured Sphaerochaeta sp.]|uniref:carbohydrate ABC transporter permease n=1 Tax=uncultured Sphaerochaeta sp. TaxID=886478 RepID=UPI002A0A2E03|nr:carbohydrate ABC transporter permease [uncultured Sphaerochaeta sp.]